MLQLRVENGTYIDLYETDPIKVNLSLESLETFKPTSTFTRSFRVPASTNNFNFFSTAFSINGLDFDVTIKKNATLLIDGDEFKKGHIRLIKIYHSNESRNIDYEIVFFGETRDFSSITGNISDIDLSEYVHDLTYSNITNSWQAYPENGIPGLNDGLFSGSVVYPLVDFGNTYEEDGDPVEAEIKFGGSSHVKPITSSNHPLPLNRFKPMIRAKVIWDKIFQEAGYTYESNFLDSNLFRHLYVTCWGNDQRISLINTQNLCKVEGSVNVTGSPDQTPFLCPNEIYDYNDNFLNGYYTAPVVGVNNYTFKVILNGISIHQVGGNYDFTMNVYKRQNQIGGTTTLLYTETSSGTAQESDVFFNFVETITTTLDASNNEQIYVDFLITGSISYDANMTFEMLSAPGEVDVSYYLDNQYKKIDFIKDIITKFKLVLSPDPNVNYKFKIEPWSEYIGTGGVKDWTNKLDMSKDIVIEPLFFNQKEEIEFTDKLGGDYLNTINIENFEEIYGTLKVDSQNELLKDKKDIKTNLVITPPTQIQGATSNTQTGANNKGLNTIVPQVHAHEVESNVVQHRPIRPFTRLLFYDGLINTGYNTANNQVWYLTDGVTTYSRTNYPMASIFSEWPVDTQTLNIAWQKEDGYIKEPELVGYDTGYGESTYERYWSDYIDLLYDKWSRRLTAYFYLTTEDIKDFSFSDVIFIKGDYFYIEKITDALLNDNKVTKVSLIKLNNYVPDTGGFEPPGNIWNEVSELWNTTLFTWND